jgi:hypothetical protein
MDIFLENCSRIVNLTWLLLFFREILRAIGSGWVDTNGHLPFGGSVANDFEMRVTIIQIE